MLKWKQIPLGDLQTNCYVLYNDQNECVIFDPGAEGKALNDWLAGNQLQPLAVLLTHAHFDHIGAVEAVRNQWNIPVLIHQQEQDWLTDPQLNGSVRFPFGGEIKCAPADRLIKEEGSLELGPFRFHMYHTPGHSPGSLSYYVEEANVVFAGDTLFSGSIGRTDLPGGDHQQLIESIENKLFSLPGETVVLSGHGPQTTVKQERQSNPFF